MALKFDYNNVMSPQIGSKHGITPQELKSALGKHAGAWKEIVSERAAGNLRFMDLPYQKDEVRDINKLVRENAKKFDNFVVIGIGGSALGNICIQTALRHPFHNMLPKEKRGGFPRMFFPDNVDPEFLGGLLETLDPKKTLFNVITKSGSTSETMANFMIVRKFLKKALGNNYGKNVIATTDATKGYLREIADKEGLLSFVVPDGVGGRFTVLSAVGLISAAFSGVNIQKLLNGAAEMDKRLMKAPLEKNPAFVNAVIHHLMDTKKRKNLAIMMPYSNALRDAADWYRQLLAESIGKKYSLNGKKVLHCGPTPIKALGATDQHSQVQLYVEGPNDKITTFLSVEQYRKKTTIPNAYPKVPAFSYLGGRTLNELIDFEQRATAIALTDANRPNITLSFPTISPETLGEFFFMYEVQIAVAGKLYGINAFDQPGVEAGKIATYALMGREGYSKTAAEIKKKMALQKKSFII